MTPSWQFAHLLMREIILQTNPLARGTLRRIRWAAPFAVIALLATGMLTSSVVNAEPAEVTFPGTDGTLTDLEADVLAAAREADFNSTYDFQTKSTTAYTPQVDVAVIELDADGNIRDRANIIVSRDYPEGTVAPIDQNLSSSSVRWLKWDQGKFDSGTYGTGADIVPGREDAPLRYMASYPASLLKSMVAFGLVFLSDHGAIDLNANYTYNGVTKSISTWSAEMIQYSNNTSSQAMIKMLHEVQYQGKTGIRFLNDELQSLGLTTLQLEGTSASNGAGWSNGGVTMTSFDTARLDLLLDGGNGGVLWTTPAGLEVTSDLLSEQGRDWLIDIWSGTAFHWMLDTGNFCNWTTPYTGSRQYPATGIPAVVPDSTLNADGTSKIAWAGSPFATIDIRPCNEQAEVTYYNKYGLTYNAGADAGIVKALPGKPFRHYIVSVMTNIGYRYGDAELAALDNPCLSNDSSFCYTEKLPILAGKIDAAIKARGEAPAKATTTTSLALSANEVVYPASVSATATVVGATPGSLVEFYDGTIKVGEATLGAEGAATLPLVAEPGEHSIVAKYTGSDSTFVSTSSVASFSVAKGDPKFAFAVSSAQYGSDPVAEVDLAADATGTVEFFRGEDSIGTIEVVEGRAVQTLSGLGVGGYPVRAEYSGDAHYTSATGLTAVVVSKAGTVASLSLGGAVYGKPVNAVAAVSPATTGQVEFTVDGKKASNVSLVNGKATTGIPGLSAGTHTVTAKFLGSDTHEISFVVGAVTVAKAAPAKVTVTAKKFKRNTKPKVTVRVAKLNNGDYPIGKIQVRVKGKKVRTVKLPKSAKGKVKVTLPKRYAKAIRVSAKFVPSSTSNVQGKVSKKVKVPFKK
ncbi:Ig-like domain-containing protein [Rarobacter faecitabidus]|uniref:Ig-like domain-containing protein n=1 Tax=Rarobacter faecitabidus TaxID=13243 RepID=A0A542ZAH9_RARFA|nr:Ig-like domain-containing protein [Rarobacter faecitabidus]